MCVTLRCDGQLQPHAAHPRKLSKFANHQAQTPPDMWPERPRLQRLRNVALALRSRERSRRQWRRRVLHRLSLDNGMAHQSRMAHGATMHNTRITAHGTRRKAYGSYRRASGALRMARGPRTTRMGHGARRMAHRRRWHGRDAKVTRTVADKLLAARSGRAPKIPNSWPRVAPKLPHNF